MWRMGKLCMCGYMGIREVSVPLQPPNFCCESKTYPKNKIHYLKNSGQDFSKFDKNDKLRSPRNSTSLNMKNKSNCTKKSLMKLFANSDKEKILKALNKIYIL